MTLFKDIPLTFPKAPAELRRDLERFSNSVYDFGKNAGQSFAARWQPQAQQSLSLAFDVSVPFTLRAAETVNISLPRPDPTNGGRACALVRKTSTGTIIVRPVGCTVDGGSSYTVPTDQGVTFFYFDGSNYWSSRGATGGGGGGDVSGPSSSTDNDIAVFDGTTGKLIKDSGIPISAIPSVGGAPVNVSKSAASAGSSGTYSRSDHKHDIDTATPGALTLSNTVAAEGSATTLARSDHSHNVSGNIPIGNMPVMQTSAVLGRATAGTGTAEVIPLGASLAMNSGNLIRAALTGDITASIGSNNTAIAANVIVNADINTAAAIQVSKLQSIQSQAFLGRGSPNTGTIEVLVPGVGISFSGTTVQRDAITGDGSVPLGSNTLTITGLPYSKLAPIQSPAFLGRGSAGTGTPEVLTLGVGISFSGTTVQRDAITGDGSVPLGSNTLTISGLALTKLQDIQGGGAFLGRGSVNTGPIEVLTRGVGIGSSGTTIFREAITGDVSVPAGSNVATISAVPLAKLPPATPCSVLGRGPNSTGTYADIPLAEGTVLLRRNNVVSGGFIVDANVDTNAAIQGIKTDANFGTLGIIGGSIALGNTPATSGIIRIPHLQGINGRDAGNNTNIPLLRWGSSATNTVTIGSSNSGYHAELFGDLITIAGIQTIPIKVNGSNQLTISTTTIDGQDNLFTTTGNYSSGSNPALNGNFRVPLAGTVRARGKSGISDVILLAGGSNDEVILGDSSSCAVVLASNNVLLRPNGTDRVQVTDTVFEWRMNTVRWDVATVSPTLNIETNSAAGASGISLTIAGQDITNSLFKAGDVQLRAGTSTLGTGGDWDTRSGVGGLAAGNYTQRVGNNIFLSWPGNLPPATNGNLRFPAQGGAYLRSNSNTFDITAFRTNSGDGMFIGEGAAAYSIGDAKIVIGTSAIEIATPQFRFDNAVSSPNITQEDATGVGTVGQPLLFKGQNSPSGIGGRAVFESGNGSNAANAGDWLARRGTATFLSVTSTDLILGNSTQSTTFRTEDSFKGFNYFVGATQVMQYLSWSFGGLNFSGPRDMISVGSAPGAIMLTFNSAGGGSVGNLGIMPKSVSPSFFSGVGVAIVGDKVSVPLISPSSGESYWYFDSGAMTTFGSNGGKWQAANNSQFNRTYLQDALALSRTTGSTGLNQVIGIIDTTVLGTNCAGTVKATIHIQDSTNALEVVEIQTGLVRNANALLVGGSGTYFSGASTIGSAAFGYSGTSNLFVKYSPKTTTSKTYKVLAEVTWAPKT